MELSDTRGEEILSGRSFPDSIKNIIHVCTENGYSFAGWKRPEDNDIFLIISFSTSTTWKNYDQPGFIINPYAERRPGKAAWINPDIILRYDGISLRCLTDSKECSEFFRKLKMITEKDKSPRRYHLGKGNNLKDTTENIFIEYAGKAIAGIGKGDFEKVVPARIKTVALRGDQTPGAIFSRLTATYKSAFKSIISHPEYGTWLGASPELFGHWTDEKEFNTISLAGTQRIGNEAEVVWNDKELEEQGIVTRFIIDQAHALGLPLVEMNGPNTVKAGRLNHLKTNLKFRLHEGQKVMDILHQLHPTPAVCGLPRNAADKFIKRNEPFDRGLYAGFLGPVNFNNSSDIYVNLRCLKLNTETAYLFAGAGMTRLSSPEKEWKETEYKCETINRVLTEFE